MFDADPIITQTDFRAGDARRRAPQVAISLDAVAMSSPMRGDHRGGRAADRRSEKRLELVVYWDRPLHELHRILDGVSDWSPFELINAAPLGYGRGGKLRVFCGFHYHGSKSDRGYFEWNLKALLDDVAIWEDAQPPERAA